ncbi:Glycogen synthase protein [Marine Group I thaumarchaeote SCGC RSA3]|uniref:Glycogen synthase protein n=2 Tax=Marine Group I TaxID=905826 RepID=A0A087RM27_9ARCH|nr:Glycogen synthase protein [Marine Group I thaumarchaeote SCGC AAA799-D11]KFM19925.1 Glycogen synthase protein [Marine Group I thaumarchaeote SCGC RSA3]
MKIGLIQSVIGAGGGYDKVLFSLLEKLSTTNHTVTVYTLGKPLVEIPKKFKIEVFLPLRIPFFGIYQTFLDSKLIKKAKNDDMIINLTTNMLTTNKDQKTIFLYKNFSLPNDKNATSKYNHGFWKLYYKPYKIILNKLKNKLENKNTRIFGSSKFVAEKMTKILNCHVEVLYPPVEIESFKNNYEQKSGIVSVSRFAREKNLEFMISIMSEIDEDLEIIGSAISKNNNYIKSLKKLIKSSNVKLLVNIPREELISHVKKSKVYFHTSNETFGISVVEAMSAGCIPIVPNSGGHKETVPFDELRYEINNYDDASLKLKLACEGKFDHYLPKIKSHAETFNKTVFQSKILKEIEN